MIPHRLKQRVPARLKRVGRLIAHLGIFSNLRSFRDFREVEASRSRGNPEQALVGLQLRPLHHRTVSIRTNSTDDRVLFGCFFHRFHVPPAGVVGERGTILDLGANIGLTMAHLACLYPGATILGVELDSDNAALCRKNSSACSDRCSVLEGAVWHEDTEVVYQPRPGIEDGYQATTLPDAGPAPGRRVRAYSLNTLIDRCPAGPVDFVKMDVEGAEREILSGNTDWAQRVRCIKVEIHGGYTRGQCAEDLERLGFVVSEDPSNPFAVIGVKGRPR